MSERAWRDHANCLDVDTELFFVGTGEFETAKQAARVYCRPCPVKAECLAEAIRLRGDHYIRGGLTPREIQRVAQKQAKEAVA